MGVQIVFWKKDSATLNPPSPRVEGKQTREKPGRQVSSAEAYKMRHSCSRTIVLMKKGSNPFQSYMFKEVSHYIPHCGTPRDADGTTFSFQLVFDKGHPVRLFIGQCPCLDRTEALLKSLHKLDSIGLSS